MKRQKIIDVDSPENQKSKKLNINWDDVEWEEEVPELEITRSHNKPPPPPLSNDDSTACPKSLNDYEIEEKLKRLKSNLSSFAKTLPDKGDKIRNEIGNLEYEKQSRFYNRHIKNAKGSLDVSKQANTKDVSQSIFFTKYSKNSEVEKQSVNQHDLSGERWRSKVVVRDTIKDKNNGWKSLPRLDKEKISEAKFYSGLKDMKGSCKPNEGYGKRNTKESSPYLLLDDDDDEEVIGYDTPRECNLKAMPLRSSTCMKKSEGKVINLDEEEEPSSPIVLEEAVELPEGLPEYICYPSKDDPELVQVSLNDLKCLSPGEYLTSEVINFYIRFLQHDVFSGNQTASNCHFFSTFFYKKLMGAVTYKGDNKDAFFVRFRKWWKGFNLFRKSYIFIPIHEDLHWSLVIICIPDKEDESGLTILHLDSLGLHSRESIFNNVKWFLRGEWNHLNQDALSVDLPIAESVWRDLPNRINEAEVKVPHQKNDFDCGLFVLYFVKRFIDEAPQRLKLHNLGMIHKKWFKPDEASALRNKMRNKLIDLFLESKQQTD